MNKKELYDTEEDLGTLEFEVMNAKTPEYRATCLRELLNQKIKDARVDGKFIEDLYEIEPKLKEEGLENFEGYFVHWDEIIKTCGQAWKDTRMYNETPLELIVDLINERDGLKNRIKELTGE